MNELTNSISSLFTYYFRTVFTRSVASIQWSFIGLSTKLYLSARTSGVILVAGFGSYCAYRICAKYLGKEFVWTMLDAARLGSLSVCQADSRLLHPAGEGYLTARLTASLDEERARRRLSQLVHSLSIDDDQTSEANCPSSSSLNDQRSTARYRMLSTRSGSPIRVICAANPLLKRALQQQTVGGATFSNSRNESNGLAAIRRSRSRSNQMQSNAISTRATIAAANDDDLMSCSGRSDLTSISRMQPPAPALRTDCRCYDVDGDLLDDDEEMSGWSRRSSAASVSSFLRAGPRKTTTVENRQRNTADSQLLIGSVAASTVGDEPSWDDEFASTSAVNCLFRPSTPSDISELSAIKNLEAMLADRPSASRTPSMIMPITQLDADDSTSSCGGTQNLTELIQSKCMEGTSYMYQSCHLGETTVDAHSMVSGFSAMSTDGSLGKERSHGFWELTSRSTPEKEETTFDASVPLSTLHPNSTVMTDSYVSRSSTSSGIRSQRKSAMFDSAIGTDMMSSDDERSSVHLPTTNNQSAPHTRSNNDVEFENKKSKRKHGRNILDKINEKPSPQKHRTISVASSSIAPSEQSLEWFQETEEKTKETEV
ncbi:hypothetical protein M3Y94_00427400 [Aphelenchoides besseyi]|nr:hypothetical protein M3Y94_00427400 [Aphelenchoides besseyi]KAI6229513.1 hypothetical protein M3Y95_00538800 [Aphelenchoides besseyi]